MNSTPHNISKAHVNPQGRWDRVVLAGALAGLAILAVAVGLEWNASRNTTSPVFANPRIAITDTADTVEPSAVAAAR